MFRKHSQLFGNNLADPKTTLCAPSLTGSLSDKRSSDFADSPRRPVWPVPLIDLTAPRRRCCIEPLLAPHVLSAVYGGTRHAPSHIWCWSASVRYLWPRLWHMHPYNSTLCTHKASAPFQFSLVLPLDFNIIHLEK